MDNIKAVIFDADGVIIDTEVFSIAYCKKYDVNIEDMLPFFKGPFQDALIGKADLKEIVAPYLKSWNWNGDIEGFLKFWFEEEFKLDQNLWKYIENMKKKGIKCYLATNQESYRFEFMKSKMGFESLFDQCFASATLGSKKPEEDFFQKLYDEIKKDIDIAKDEIVFWDDDQKNVDGGNEFGIKSYFYKSFEDFDEKMKKQF